MRDTIKGFRGKDGPIRLDYSGVANVPGAIQSIGALTAQPGDHFEVETVDSTGRVATVKAVEKPGGGSGQNPNQSGLSDAAKTLLITILRAGMYSTNQRANITALEAELASSGGDTPDVPETPDVPDTPETPESGVTITQSGSTLTMSGVPAITSITQSASVLSLA